MVNLKLIVSILITSLLLLWGFTLLIAGEKNGTANKVADVPRCRILFFEEFPNQGKVVWHQLGYKTKVRGKVDLDDIENWIPNESDRFRYQAIREMWPTAQPKEWVQNFRMTEVDGPHTYHLEIESEGQFSILVH